MLAGKLYPDNSLSIGYCPEPSITEDDKKYDRDHEAQYNSYLETHLEYGRTVTREVRFFDPSPCSPLLVKGQESSRKPKKTYGDKGMTLYGKRVVKNGTLLLEQKYGKENLGFGTATIPSFHREALEVIIGNWGEIVRRYLQKIKRCLERKGYKFVYTCVTEIQEKRFERTGIAAPHLHFVYVARQRGKTGWYLTTKEAYSFWNEAVNEVLLKNNKAPTMGVGSHSGSVKLEAIKKSAAAYLGKYISKGSKVVEAMKEEGYTLFPRQWWSASKFVKSLFKAYTVAIPLEIAKLVFYEWESLLEDGYLSWAREVWVDVRGTPQRLGISAKITSKGRKAFSL